MRYSAGAILLTFVGAIGSVVVMILWQAIDSALGWRLIAVAAFTMVDGVVLMLLSTPDRMRIVAGNSNVRMPDESTVGQVGRKIVSATSTSPERSLAHGEANHPTRWP